MGFYGCRETFCNGRHQLPVNVARVVGKQGGSNGENFCGTGLIVVVVVSMGFTAKHHSSLYGLLVAQADGGE